MSTARFFNSHSPFDSYAATDFRRNSTVPTVNAISTIAIIPHLEIAGITLVQTLGSPVQFHPASTVQVAEQPSPSSVFPSSHCSVPATTPLPHVGVVFSYHAILLSSRDAERTSVSPSPRLHRSSSAWPRWRPAWQPKCRPPRAVTDLKNLIGPVSRYGHVHTESPLKSVEHTV